MSQTKQVREFIAANSVSPVVAGSALPHGGGIYELKNGTIFKFTLDECKSMPMPKWPWDFEGYTE